MTELFYQRFDLVRCAFFFRIDFPDIGRWDAIGFGEVLEAAFAGYDEFFLSRDVVKFLLSFLIKLV